MRKSGCGGATGAKTGRAALGFGCIRSLWLPSAYRRHVRRVDSIRLVSGHMRRLESNKTHFSKRQQTRTGAHGAAQKKRKALRPVQTGGLRHIRPTQSRTPQWPPATDTHLVERRARSRQEHGEVLLLRLVPLPAAVVPAGRESLVAQRNGVLRHPGGRQRHAPYGVGDEGGVGGHRGPCRATLRVVSEENLRKSQQATPIHSLNRKEGAKCINRR